MRREEYVLRRKRGLLLEREGCVRRAEEREPADLGARRSRAARRRDVVHLAQVVEAGLVVPLGVLLERH